MKINIDKIVFDKELYPRSDFDNSKVNEYSMNIEGLPEIVVNKDNILIDGYHRLLACRLNNIKETEVKVENIAREDILWESTKRNATHGLALNLEDKRSLAIKRYEQWINKEKEGDSNDDAIITEISSVLGIGKRTLKENWLKDIRQREREKRNDEVLDLYLACWTQDEIAEKIHIERSSVSKIIKNVKKSATAEKFTLDSLQLYNVWSFQNRDNIIYKLYMLGWTSKEIEDIVGLKKSQISDISDNTNFSKIGKEYDEGKPIEEIAKYYGLDLTTSFIEGSYTHEV
jgi:predicted DNA-binding protein YlxM (UPF0122 family)